MASKARARLTSNPQRVALVRLGRLHHRRLLLRSCRDHRRNGWVRVRVGARKVERRRGRQANGGRGLRRVETEAVAAAVRDGSGGGARRFERLGSWLGNE